MIAESRQNWRNATATRMCWPASRMSSAVCPARRRRARDGGGLTPERRPHACVRRGRPAAPTTLAGSLSVALHNARLLDESRQRVAELATVNRVGQALSSQLDLDALIELVGEQVRETFTADIAYVALHDRQSGRIDFAYYYESGERIEEASIAYGEGLTSQILESRDRCCSTGPRNSTRRRARSGPRSSFLGVRSCSGGGDRVISVQSIEAEGRFGRPTLGCSPRSPPMSESRSRTRACSSEVERQREYLESLPRSAPRRSSSSTPMSG